MKHDVPFPETCSVCGGREMHPTGRALEVCAHCGAEHIIPGRPHVPDLEGAIVEAESIAFQWKDDALVVYDVICQTYYAIPQALLTRQLDEGPFLSVSYEAKG